MASLPDEQSEDVDLPLRERLPEYVTVFLVGIAGASVVGSVIALVWRVGIAEAIGYTVVSLGILLLLAGGASGGGYTSMGIGAAGALFGTRRSDEASEDLGDTWSGKPRQSPQDRLREGLRPEANARAFWQVIGGFLYVAVGVAIVATFAA